MGQPIPWLRGGHLDLFDLTHVGNTVTLDLHVGGQVAMDRPVRITLHMSETPCHYGGQQPLFHCPWCGRWNEG